MDPDSRRALLTVNWAELGVRLVGYATWRARNLQWRTQQTWELAGGKTPEDIASEAILKVLEGTRRWDPERGSLLPFLRGIVDSLMSHLAQSSDNRIQEPWRGEDEGDVRGARPQIGNRHRAVADPSDERLERLRAALAENGNDELIEIIDAVTRGCDPKPQSVAVWLGTTVADVNNRLKRLRRLAQKLERRDSQALAG